MTDGRESTQSELDLFDRAWSHPQEFHNYSTLFRGLEEITKSGLCYEVLSKMARRIAANLLAAIKTVHDEHFSIQHARRSDEHLEEMENSAIKNGLCTVLNFIDGLIPTLPKGSSKLNPDEVRSTVENVTLLYLSLALAKALRPPPPPPEPLTAASIEQKLRSVVTGGHAE